MDITKVKADIKSKNVGNFYIFAGDEWKVQQIYIEQIAKAKNLRIKRINSITDIYINLQNKSLLLSDFCYVCREDEAIIHSEQLWKQIKERKIFGDNIYILLLTNIDKRTKFYKEFQNDIVLFEHLEPNILKKYIKKEIELSDKNCEKLMEVCEYDYGRCLLEIDKIKRYCTVQSSDGKPTLLADTAFDWLLKDGAIYQPPKDAIFDFVDAVLRRDINLSYKLLDECYKIGEATMVILSVLFNSARDVLQVQTCRSQDVGKVTGLSAWNIKLARDRLRYYTEEDLIYMLRKIQQIESGIKSGKIEEDFAVNYLLAKIM